MTAHPDPQTLLPHRPPMCLIDRVIAISSTHACAQATITRSHIFFRPHLDGMAIWSGIELMAQAIGLYAGYRRKALEPPGIGLLLSVRRFIPERLLIQADETLIISVHRQLLENRLGVFTCHIQSMQHEALACATLNAYLPPHHEIDALLKGDKLP